MNDVMFPQVLEPCTYLFEHFHDFILFLFKILFLVYSPILLVAILKRVSKVTAFTIFRNNIKEAIVLHL